MEQPEKTILVTGGSGFLGSHLVDAFLAEGGFHVIATSRNPTKYRNPQATYIACDITKHSEIAAIIDPFASPLLHERDYAATKNLIAIASKTASVRIFVYSGSAESLANFSGAYEQPLTEAQAILHTPSTAPSLYANVKSASEVFVLRASETSLASAVLWMLGLYGPRENEKTGITVNFIRIANTFATRIQLGTNSVLHEWIYVENAARAHMLAVKALLDLQQRAGGEAYFTTDGVPIKLWDFVRQLWIAAGDENCSSVRKIIVPWWIVLVLAATTEIVFRVFTLGRMLPPLSRLHVHYMKEGAWFDIGKARDRLGDAPLVSTDEGINRTVSWFQQLSRGEAADKTQ